MKVDNRMMKSSHVPEIIEFGWSSGVGKLLEHSAQKELLSRQWTDLSVQQGFKLIQTPYHQLVDHEGIEEQHQKKHRGLCRCRKKMQEIENQILELERLAGTLHVTSTPSNSIISPVSTISFS